MSIEIIATSATEVRAEFCNHRVRGIEHRGTMYFVIDSDGVRNMRNRWDVRVYRQEGFMVDATPSARDKLMDDMLAAVTAWSNLPTSSAERLRAEIRQCEYSVARTQADVAAAKLAMTQAQEAHESATTALNHANAQLLALAKSAQ